MLDLVADFVKGLTIYANQHGVNPIIFLVIYFGSTPFILLPIYFLGKEAVKKESRRTILLIGILIFGVLMPYLYIVIFGRDINILIRILVIGVALISVIRVLSKKVGIKPMDIIKKLTNQK